MSNGKLSRLALAFLLIAGVPSNSAFAKGCQLDAFTGEAQKAGWILQELTYEERVNFLNHLNHDDGVRTNFYPPHLFETVRKDRDRIHIRVVFVDDGNCVLGNSGEIGFNEFSYLLTPNVGF